MANFKRTDRISEEIKKALSDIIRELKDPRIPLMTSVVSVEVTGDLRYAKALVSIMGDEQTKKEALKGLKSASGFIRRELGSRVRLRCTPEVIFRESDSIERGAHINELLHKVLKEENVHEEDSDSGN